MPPRLPTPRNHTFISFAAEDNAHAGRRWADWLAKELEGFSVPESVAGRPTPAGPVPPRLGPVGRSAADSEEISPKQRTAVVESRTLIVICSPVAARSARVAEEVRLFKQFSQGRVLALIVEGEPDTDLVPGASGLAKTECFPETLRHEVRPDGTVDRGWRVQPITVDLRVDGESGFTAQGTYLAVLNAAKKAPAEENQKRAEAYGARLEEARRTLVAGVLGVPPGDLEVRPEEAGRETRDVGRPQAGRPRRGGRFSLVVILLLLLVAGGLGWVAYQALEQKVTAEGARERADRLIIFLQRDLHQKLTPNGQTALAASANDQIIQYLTGIARESKNPEIFGALADALGNAADLLIAQENLTGGYETALEAVRVRQQAMALPNAPAENGIRQVADLRRVAEISNKVGKTGDALSIIEQARTLAAKLARDLLGDSDVARESVRADYTAAAILLEGGKVPEATRAALQGRSLANFMRKRTVELRKQHATSPNLELEWQEESIRGSEQLGEIYQRSGDFPNALVEYREALKQTAEMAAQNASDMTLQSRVAKLHMRIGNRLSMQNRFDEAAAEFRSAVEFAERAARGLPSNVETQFDYVMACRRLAETLAYGEQRNPSDILLYFQKAIEHLNTRIPAGAGARATELKVTLEALRDDLMRRPPPARVPPNPAPSINPAPAPPVRL